MNQNVPRCGDCAHWKPYTIEPGDIPIGKCKSSELITGYLDGIEKPNQIRIDGVRELEAGIDFGCVNYEQRP